MLLGGREPLMERSHTVVSPRRSRRAWQRTDSGFVGGRERSRAPRHLHLHLHLHRRRRRRHPRRRGTAAVCRSAANRVAWYLQPSLTQPTYVRLRNTCRLDKSSGRRANGINGGAPRHLPVRYNSGRPENIPSREYCSYISAVRMYIIYIYTLSRGA